MAHVGTIPATPPPKKRLKKVTFLLAIFGGCAILFAVMRDMNIEIKVIRKATCSICECEVEVKRDTWTEDLMCDRCTWFWYKGYKGKPQSDNSAALVEVAKKTKQGLLKSN